ncbi:MAG TPA: DUF934 domain-containing protein [Ramlibacter sp.]|uniref:DUF934 domain-containing protein n=1 Tax=Ramlibacter sp. TaxID=1917967 RepID=UPI002B5F60CB|nr:DUF934 domain-containing protein [Ramlibacter sp.]HVZ43731.1 DUF934 domain-containing protein [Ramlibacter sp.]
MTLQLIATPAANGDGEDANVLVLANDADVHDVPLEGVDRIELNFPKFTDGRAYTQAVLLRQRRGFAGDIRATGNVLVDQLVHMERCGFSSAVLAEGQDPADVPRQFVRFADFYQGDAVKQMPRYRRTA